MIAMIGNALLLALRELRRNVMRSILTMLGIMIGVASHHPRDPRQRCDPEGHRTDRQPRQQSAHAQSW